MEEICVIVGAHPSDEYKTSILEDCLRSMQLFSLHTIVSAHCLPTRDISHLCDSYLCDSKNELIQKEEMLSFMTPDSPCNFFADETFVYRSQIDLFQTQTSHHYSVFLNIVNGAKLAKERGFKSIIYTEGDHIFDPHEFLEFLKSVKGKRGLFFKGNPQFLNAFSTLLFYVEIEFFLDQVEHINSKNEWIETVRNNDGGYTVEKVFTSIFSPLSKDSHYRLEVLNITDDWLSPYFSNSTINRITFGADQTLPWANFCSKWADGTEEQNFWFYVSMNSEEHHVISTITADGEEFLRLEHGSNYRKYFYTAVNLAPLYEKNQITFKNVYGNGTEKSFTLNGEELRAYLRLNTMQFVNS